MMFLASGKGHTQTVLPQQRTKQPETAGDLSNSQNCQADERGVETRKRSIAVMENRRYLGLH